MGAGGMDIHTLHILHFHTKFASPRDPDMSFISYCVYEVSKTEVGEVGGWLNTYEAVDIHPVRVCFSA